jgi:hypothetical protein
MTHAEEFGQYLRTVDNLDRSLTKTEYRVITGLMDQAYDYEAPFEVIDRLHWFIEKKDTCPQCGDARCGCPYHQQSCSHIINAYMEEQARDRELGLNT